ncbi:Hypothetical protein PHPALM_1325 [Phytophthora palmivora]|uniref:Transposase n=1 Tax=Phytophthora palmivora TaxID=4796 RepID=A0A2P4YSK2_9STRA|nr:Hypothetical protein PHPALM_1325 [Phytophthora palmivora]
MGRGKVLTNQEHDGGVSVHEIARRTGRSRACVRLAVKEERGPRSDTGGERPRAGWRPALTGRKVQRLVRVAYAGDKFAAELKAELGFKTSVRTVQRLLQRVNLLVYAKMDRTLPFTTAHKTARMRNMGIYCIFWRKNSILTALMASRTTGVTCVSKHGRTFIGKMMVVASWYGEHLALKYMLPFAHRNYGVGFVFQLDNASIHASHKTTSFLLENYIITMVCPARSPDCKLIENGWSVYSHNRKYLHVDELECANLAAWNSIEQEYLLKLVQSMPRRCLAVIKKKADSLNTNF